MAGVSQIRFFTIGQDRLTLTYAYAQPHYAPLGERITDRRGLTHRITPGVVRYPVGLTIGLHAAELARLSDGVPTPRPAVAWLEYYFRAQAEQIVFINAAGVDSGGGALSRNLAYTGYIEELPGQYFGTLPGAGPGPDYVELELWVGTDGTFSDFDNPGSMVAFTPPRGS
jgi:hypothetical protein